MIREGLKRKRRASERGQEEGAGRRVRGSSRREEEVNLSGGCLVSEGEEEAVGWKLVSGDDNRGTLEDEGCRLSEAGPATFLVCLMVVLRVREDRY